MGRFYKTWLSLIIATCLTSAFADESMNYSQKTLPNGDVQTIYTASDGSSVVSIQHKDGSVETTSTAADGTKSVSIQHADGSIDTHIVSPK